MRMRAWIQMPLQAVWIRSKVVPNPYVMTNMMEEAVTNPYLNQRRKLLFTQYTCRLRHKDIYC